MKRIEWALLCDITASMWKGRMAGSLEELEEAKSTGSFQASTQDEIAAATGSGMGVHVVHRENGCTVKQIKVSLIARERWRPLTKSARSISLGSNGRNSSGAKQFTPRAGYGHSLSALA